MKRMRMTGLAAFVAAMGLGAAVQAADGPTESPAWARGLCESVEEGVRLLEGYHLAPEEEAARAALLEALIRAAEPAVVFLDEAGLTARTERLSDQAWYSGVTLVSTDGLPKVAAVQKDSPAEAAGIQPGEWIEKVEETGIQDGTRLQEVRDLFASGEAPELALGLRDEEGKSRTVTVERVRRAESSVADVENLPADMGYIRVAGIYPGAAGEIASALEAWQSTDVFGAILDLRGADGTAEEEVPALAARFTEEGAVLYTMADRQGGELVTVRAPAAPVETMPVMVLTDEGTTAAAELLAAVLGGSVKGAMLIGRETAGDPMIREPLRLSIGRHALLATRQVRTADGSVYDGTGGVAPDVAISDVALGEILYEPETPVLRRGKTLSDEEKEDKALRDRTRNDTYLRRAADVLLGLQALGYDRER